MLMSLDFAFLCIYVFITVVRAINSSFVLRKDGIPTYTPDPRTREKMKYLKALSRFHNVLS